MEREKERVRDEHSYMYIHTGYKSWLPGEGRPTSVLIIISSLCNEDDLNQIYMYNIYISLITMTICLLAIRHWLFIDLM